MIELRPFASLGHADHGWLDARHHFSFANYHDPSRMGWGNLRVWNDDTIQPMTGFPAHPHADMEIITYVRSGAISHKDSEGNEGRTEAGDVQVMSAGRGITHAEYNLEEEPTRLFQIWILPDSRGGKPDWGTRPFPKDARAGRFVALASGFPEDSEALTIRAPARVLGATLKAGEQAEYHFGPGFGPGLSPGRKGYLVPATGAIEVGGMRVNTRDGAGIRDLETIVVTAIEDSEIVLVDTL